MKVEDGVEMRNDLPTSRTYLVCVREPSKYVLMNYVEKKCREIYIEVNQPPYIMMSFRTYDMNDINYYSDDGVTVTRYKRDGTPDRTYTHVNPKLITSEGREYTIHPLSEDEIFPGTEQIERDFYTFVPLFKKIHPSVFKHCFKFQDTIPF